MATNNLLNEDDKKILADENEINDRNFQQFHKKVFDEMRNQAIFLACKIMERNGKRPGDGDFENEINYLLEQIIKEKFELLGTYLK